MMLKIKNKTHQDETFVGNFEKKQLFVLLLCFCALYECLIKKLNSHRKMLIACGTVEHFNVVVFLLSKSISLLLSFPNTTQGEYQR